MGLVTDQERTEFEAYCVQYPEVAQARDAFERSLESSLVADAVPPPQFLREKIRERVLESDRLAAVEEEPAEEVTPVRKLVLWKWIAAASIVLLAVSLYWGITANNRSNKLQDIAKENETLKTQLAATTSQLEQVRADAEALQQPDVKMASLKGTPVSPASYVTVYWDTTNKDVYLMVNNLPKPAGDKQYQLWALIDIKPVELGVLQMSQEKLIPMVKMKGVQNAQAFAITLEPRGGSQNPTLDQMYVVGKL